MKKTLFLVAILLLITTLSLTISTPAKAITATRNSSKLVATNSNSLIINRIPKNYSKFNSTVENFISKYPIWLRTSFADLTTAISNYSDIAIVTKGSSVTFATVKGMESTFLAPIYDVENQKCLLGKDFLTLLYFISITSPLTENAKTFPIEFCLGFIDANSLVNNNCNLALCIRNYNMVLKIEAIEDFYVPVFYSSDGEDLLFCGSYYTELMSKLPKNK